MGVTSALDVAASVRRCFGSGLCLETLCVVSGMGASLKGVPDGVRVRIKVTSGFGYFGHRSRAFTELLYSSIVYDTQLCRPYSVVQL